MEYEISPQKYKQLEQTLSQLIQNLYVTQVGQKPDLVFCQIIDKNLTIVIENATTTVERFLTVNDKQELAEQVRANIHKALKPQLKALIEEVLEIKVVDLVGDSNFSTGRTSVTAILATNPKASTSFSLLQVKQQNVSDLDGS